MAAGWLWGFAVTQTFSCVGRQGKRHAKKKGCLPCAACLSSVEVVEEGRHMGSGVKIAQGVKSKKGQKRSKVSGKLGSWPAATVEALAESKKHSNTQKCLGGAKA